MKENGYIIRLQIRVPPIIEIKHSLTHFISIRHMSVYESTSLTGPIASCVTFPVHVHAADSSDVVDVLASEGVHHRDDAQRDWLLSADYLQFWGGLDDCGCLWC